MKLNKIIAITAILGCMNLMLNAQNADIYVAGRGINANDDFIAKWWKNGTGHNLPLPYNAIRSEATSIFVSGNDVYVAGFEIMYEDDRARLWKNGVAQNLANSIGNGGAIATSVFVSNNDVYVVGDVNGIAKLWKNGIDHDLATTSSYAQDIFVVDTNVYVAGRIGGTATVWRNGVARTLSNSSSPHSIYVQDTDVYVAGYKMIYDANPYNDRPTAKLWKNNEEINIFDETLSSQAYDVAVHNDTVYVLASYVNGGSSVSVLWKNGVQQILGGNPYRIFIAGNDIYLAGGRTIWKNGVQHSVINATEVSINALFVVNKATNIEAAVIEQPHLYPNPAKEQFTVVLPEDITNATFIMYDMTGREIKNDQLQFAHGKNAIVNVAGMPTGLYVYTILAKDKKYRGKIIVE